jgi:hypothetical protein
MNADGTGVIMYRAYKWCSADPIPPCDEMQGNNIIDGGRITLHFDTAYSAGAAVIAQGAITSSTDTSLTPGSRLTARKFGYIVALSDGFTFCAANTPPTDWVCGA